MPSKKVTHSYNLIVQNFDLCTIIYKYFDFLSCVCQQKSALKHGCPKNLVIHRLNMEKWAHSCIMPSKKVTHSYNLIVQNFDLYTIIYKYFDFLSCVCQQKSALKHGCPKNLVIHRLNMEKWGHSYILT